jgi:hypothetical protein
LGTVTVDGKNRIMIFGPKSDGTYVVEFRTAAGEALAISMPVQLAVVASVEQTKAGCREKETKSGRARTVALSTTMIEELRRRRLEQVCYAGLAGGTLRAG